MATKINQLNDVRQRINTYKYNSNISILHEDVLGQELFFKITAFIGKVFEFHLIELEDKESNSYIAFSGEFIKLYDWKNVKAEFFFFDSVEPELLEKQAHCIFTLEIPVEKNLTDFIYSLIFNLHNDVLESPNIEVLVLGNFFDKAEFEFSAQSERKLVFSTFNYAASSSTDTFYPDVCNKLVDRHQVGKGVNFPIKNLFENDFSTYLLETFEDYNKKPNNLTEESNDIGLISFQQDNIILTLSKAIHLEFKIDAFEIKCNELGLQIPFFTEELADPSISLNGEMRIGDKSIKLNAEFDPHYQYFNISCSEFPSLEKIISLIDTSYKENYFPEPFSSLLSIRLSKLSLGFSLINNSISEISFYLDTSKPIKIIENIIEITPSFQMQIYSPFRPEHSTVEGCLSGIWHLGKTNLETVVYYPSFDFSANMIKGEVDIDEILKIMFKDIELPKSNIRITQIDLRGNLKSKYFIAEILVTDHWGFSLAGQAFSLMITGLMLEYEYENQNVSATIYGGLTLAGIELMISAEYQGAGMGWILSGRTVSGANINLTAISHDLLESMSLPTVHTNAYETNPRSLADLELTDLFFTAHPKSGYYSLSGRTARDWPLLDNLSLQVDEFSAEKNPGVSVSGCLRVSLTVAGVLIRLKAEKAATVTGGWKFDGTSGNGKKIEFDAIVKWISTPFGEVSLPAGLESLVVEYIHLAFDSQSKDFLFTCEGQLTLPQQTSPLQAVILIDLKHQADKSYTKLFSGSVMFDGMEFDLIFQTTHQTGVGDSKMLVAAYHDQKGHAVSLDDFAARILKLESHTQIFFDIKSAVFAAHFDKTASKYLFGLDIESGLNLADLKLPNLPLLSSGFTSEQTLKLAFRGIAVSRHFSADDLTKLNALTGNGLNLPHQAVEKLDLSVLLHIGQDIKTLDLPLGLAADKTGIQELPEGLPPKNADSPQNKAVAAQTDSIQWLKIQKNFGPIHVERVGVGYKSGNIRFMLDSTLSAAGLALSLDGLSADFALRDVTQKTFKPSFHLNGLGLDYRNGAVEIGGSFLQYSVEENGKNYTGYGGQALIRTAKLSLSAIGAYAQINNSDPSLFVYAVADYPLGGPAFFFVTGFAAGFGYNRRLMLPEIEQISSFPLVADAVKSGGPQNLPAGQDKQQPFLNNKLQQLQQYLPPAVGEVFIAAGVKFNSFKQIDSFALLAVKFGRRFEIDLLGVSTLSTPAPNKGQQVAPVAQAELALKASFIPEEGVLGVQAQLTPNSYIFSKDCHLTGGFAFYSWFAPHPQAGDFVLTLGGYHPQYIVPEHYPKPPRLAVNWQVTPELHVKADAYFALTGSALMTGGHLQVLWQHDKLKAWLNAGADFILAWQPYHYDARIYVEIGVAYTFEVFGSNTLTFDLGADLHLWGPEFCLEATVHLSVISFTIRHGKDAPQLLTPIQWETFQAACLPKTEQICSISLQQGLLRQMPAENHAPASWVVNAKDMVLAVNTVIPLTKGELDGQEFKIPKNNFAIAPMGKAANKLISSLQIKIKRNGIDWNDRNYKLILSPIYKDMPAGLWGTPHFAEDGVHLLPPNINGPQLVKDMLAGFEIRPKKTKQEANSREIKQSQLQQPAKTVDNAFSWSKDFALTDKIGPDAWSAARESILNKTKERNELFKVLSLAKPVVDLGESVS